MAQVPHDAERRSTAAGKLRILRSFTELTESLNKAKDTEDVLEQLANCVQSALEWNDYAIYLVDRPGTLMQRAAFGSQNITGTGTVDPLSIGVCQGIVSVAADTGETQLITDTRLDNRNGGISGKHRRSQLAVPILSDGQVIGVIEGTHGEAGFFGEDDAHLLRDIAALAAVRVNIAITMERLVQDHLQLSTLANTDDLTGLGNRRLFTSALADLVTAGEPFSVATLDLDAFKNVNDLLGHHRADGVLTTMGKLLRTLVADDDETVLCRLGGDEFGILRRGETHEQLGDELEKVIASVRRTEWAHSSSALNLTVSAGAASGTGRDTWVDADDALVLAKRLGGDRLVRLGSLSPDAKLLHEDRKWVERIQRSIRDDRFVLVAQPVVPTDHTGSAPEFYEVLLRYPDDDGTLQSPIELLTCAATNGLLEDIDGWVIRHTIEWLGLNPTISASINVTPSSMTSGFVIEQTMSALARYGVEPERLILEVPEQAAFDDPAGFKSAVTTTRTMGIRVAIDDVGSGWTSLAVLRENPVDFIKVDGKWVSSAATDEFSRVAVQSIIECAHLLNTKVVAEWVEDEATRALMSSMDVEFVQGWLTGAAFPLIEVGKGATAAKAA